MMAGLYKKYDDEPAAIGDGGRRVNASPLAPILFFLSLCAHMPCSSLRFPLATGIHATMTIHALCRAPQTATTTMTASAVKTGTLSSSLTTFRRTHTLLRATTASTEQIARQRKSGSTCAGGGHG